MKMGKMTGNMKRVGTDIPGAPDQNPPAGRKGSFDRVAGNETTYYDQKLRPGPHLMRPAKRGKRISGMRTANDAAMALSEAFRKRFDSSSDAGYSKKNKKKFFQGIGYSG
jgi:hypothetical protein